MTNIYPNKITRVEHGPPDVSQDITDELNNGKDYPFVGPELRTCYDCKDEHQVHLSTKFDPSKKAFVCPGCKKEYSISNFMKIVNRLFGEEGPVDVGGSPQPIEEVQKTHKAYKTYLEENAQTLAKEIMSTHPKEVQEEFKKPHKEDLEAFKTKMYDKNTLGIKRSELAASEVDTQLISKITALDLEEKQELLKTLSIPKGTPIKLGEHDGIQDRKTGIVTLFERREKVELELARNSYTVPVILFNFLEDTVGESSMSTLHLKSNMSYSCSLYGEAIIQAWDYIFASEESPAVIQATIETFFKVGVMQEEALENTRPILLK